MTWLFQLHSTQPVAHAIGIIALVCFAGRALGSLKLRGVGLGTAGVLFAGILAGHFAKPVSKATFDSVKEFGLVLFICTIGLQLGPGFFAALQQQGVKQDALAVPIVVLGDDFAPLLGWFAGFDMAAVLPLVIVCSFACTAWKMIWIDLSGLLAGSTTNPRALTFATSMARSDAPTLAYATVYPLTMLPRILCARLPALILCR